MFGQLGHGDKASYCSPKLVTALDGIPVRDAVCGEDFTVCLSEEGEVYACGSDYWGCLGQGNPVEQEKSCTVPVPVPLPENLHIEQISCGDTHVMALTRSKEVFSWGCGKYGRLGLGSEMNVSTPQKVQLPGQSPVVSLSCAGRGSLLLTANGRLLACGDNQLNQLGLNVALRLRASEAKGTQLVSYKTVPSQVKALSRYR
jgi:NIMA (never in mitosis gene a)-related kinase